MNDAMRSLIPTTGGEEKPKNRGYPPAFLFSKTGQQPHNSGHLMDLCKTVFVSRRPCHIIPQNVCKRCIAVCIFFYRLFAYKNAGSTQKHARARLVWRIRPEEIASSRFGRGWFSRTLTNHACTNGLSRNFRFDSLSYDIDSIAWTALCVIYSKVTAVYLRQKHSNVSLCAPHDHASPRIRGSRSCRQPCRQQRTRRVVLEELRFLLRHSTLALWYDSSLRWWCYP